VDRCNVGNAKHERVKRREVLLVVKVFVSVVALILKKNGFFFKLNFLNYLNVKKNILK